jgi:glc operon protein GlcG
MRKAMYWLTLALCCAGGVTPAAAQIARFVQQGEDARKVGDRYVINEETAHTIVDGCRAYARAQGKTMSIAILDQFGNQVLFDRTNGQGRINGLTAVQKALTVVNTRRPSSDVTAAIARGETTEFRAGQYNEEFEGPGGLPIVVEDQFLGGVGVASPGGVDSGFNEACARAGLAAAFGPEAARPAGAR